LFIVGGGEGKKASKRGENKRNNIRGRMQTRARKNVSYWGGLKKKKKKCVYPGKKGGLPGDGKGRGNARDEKKRLVWRLNLVGTGGRGEVVLKTMGQQQGNNILRAGTR